MYMDQNASKNALRRSSTLPEVTETNDCDDSNENTMAKENMLLKAQFFCRMGMGKKTIQSMSHEHRTQINTYFQEKTAKAEELSPVKASCTVGSPRISIPDESFEKDLDESTDAEQAESPEEWVKKNLIKKNMLLKANMLSRMGLTCQSLDSLSPQNKLLLSRCHKQQSLEKETREETLDADLTLERTYSNIEGDFEMKVLKKTDDQARTCYYNRLIQMKILKMTPSKKNQSIIIFDWDDTLLSTTYLIALGIKGVAPSVVSVMRPLDEMASQLLNKTTELGQVYIITNAEQGWVQYSAQVFLPKTYKVIQEKFITVISARTCYQGMFPKDNTRWKKEAFSSLTKDFEKGIVTNLICLGDSNIEMDAAQQLGKQFDQAIIKTIKFKEHPKPEELVKQLTLVLDKFDQIFVSLKNSTIRLERK